MCIHTKSISFHLDKLNHNIMDKMLCRMCNTVCDCVWYVYDHHVVCCVAVGRLASHGGGHVPLYSHRIGPSGSRGQEQCWRHSRQIQVWRYSIVSICLSFIYLDFLSMWFSSFNLYVFCLLGLDPSMRLLNTSICVFHLLWIHISMEFLDSFNL